jgi:hypothetical protein
VARARKLAAVPDLERELDELFGLPLGEFTTARNELVKRLRAAGEKEQAEEVRRLSKPSVAAWAVNQLARTDKRDVKRLLDAGANMRKVHERALAERAGEEFRKATAAERELVRTLGERARTILQEAGHPPSDQVLKRISETLRAASTDDDARELLERGRLTKEIEPTGFGSLSAVPLTPRPVARTAARPKREERSRLQRELRELRASLQQAQREAVRAANDARQARELAEKASVEAEERQEVAADLAEQLEELESSVRECR